jgi:hypothetical protein
VQKSILKCIGFRYEAFRILSFDAMRLSTALLYRKVVVVVDYGRLVAYADESEQPDSPHSPYLIAAYVLPADIWIQFADQCMIAVSTENRESGIFTLSKQKPWKANFRESGENSVMPRLGTSLIS